MSQRHLVLTLAIVLLCSFTLFSRFVKLGGMKETDFATTVKVQERIDNSSRLRIARLTGEIMEGATFLASPMVATVAMVILTFLTTIKLKKWRWVALAIPILFGLMTLAEIYGKSVVHHPAPPFFLLKNPTTIFPKYYVQEDYSYPSGHAARAIFLGISIFSYLFFHTSFFKRMNVKLLISIGIISYVCLIAVSRIYLGHHWASDVIAGLLLGGGSGLLTQSITLPYNTKRNE